MSILPIVRDLRQVYDQGAGETALVAAGTIAALYEALKMAEQFIENGIEYGYIRMPDPDTPDSAHKTLPAIEAALSLALGEKQA